MDASTGDLGGRDLGARDAGSELDGGEPPCRHADECSDGDRCNGEERCTAEGCKPGRPPTCDDTIDCTVDSCDPSSGDCVHVATDALCDAAAGGVCDASADCQYPTCTPATCVASGCSDAVCVGSMCVLTTRCEDTEECCGERCVPRDCDDEDPCTDDVCNGGASACQHELNAVACDDGNGCTLADFCHDGVCTSSTLMLCEVLDGNPCVMSSCDAATGGCVEAPVANGMSCTFPGVTGACDGAGNCISGACPPGLVDCDGDDACECTLGVGIGCLGTLCVRASDCPVACSTGEICCPSTRLCVDRPSACPVSTD
jgi:hypothetical protein